RLADARHRMGTARRSDHRPPARNGRPATAIDESGPAGRRPHGRDTAGRRTPRREEGARSLRTYGCARHRRRREHVGSALPDVRGAHRRLSARRRRTIDLDGGRRTPRRDPAGSRSRARRGRRPSAARLASEFAASRRLARAGPTTDGSRTVSQLEGRPSADPAFLDPLLELLRIPSVSTGDADPKPIREAAEWLRDYITANGGKAEIEATNGNPLVIGRFDANRPDAPNVLIYGHYDVQGAEPLSLWETPPFEPTIKDGRIYARGASDDKGNFWPLLYAACEMHASGELPVNVRALVEGEEENGSVNVMTWLAADREPTDAAIVYDSGTIAGGPTITLGGRGVIGGYVRVRVADHDLHSGIHGGVALNALHVLIRMFSEVLHGPDGLLRDELRAGIDPIPDAERAMWPVLDDPNRPLTGVGARPIAPDSGARYFEITGWEPSLEVDEIRAGDPRTV